MDLYIITARFDEHRASSSSKYPFALQYRGTILMEFIHYKHLTLTICVLLSECNLCI